MGTATSKARERMLSTDGRFIGELEIEEFLEEIRMRFVVYADSLWEGAPTEEQVGETVQMLLRGLMKDGN